MDGGSISVVRGYNRGGTGSTSVTVVGSGLGVGRYTGSLRLGQTGCEGTEWESETSLTCLVGSGLFASRRVVLTAGDFTASISIAFSYDGSLISSPLRVNMFSTGSAVVTLHGVGLGMSLFSGSARVGVSSCEYTSWRSDSSLFCLVVSGFARTSSVILTFDRSRSSISEQWSYDLPQISSTSTHDFFVDTTSFNFPVVIPHVI